MPKRSLETYLPLTFFVMRDGREIYRFGDRGVARYCAKRERISHPRAHITVVSSIEGEIHV